MLKRFFSCLKFRRLLAAARSRKGSTAVEMALVAPVFFLLMMGIVETTLILMTQHLIENAAYNASRLAKTGYVANGESQMQTVTDILDRELSSLGGVIDVNKIQMSSTAYSNLSNIGASGQGSAGLGGSSQIVVYTVTYPWKLFTPMMSAIIGSSGTLNLTSRIVVRNEPY